MPKFDVSVETFLDQVIGKWSELLQISAFDKCCDELYKLYYTETETVLPSKSDGMFKKCMNGLIELHKQTGGAVKTKSGYVEFHTNDSLMAKLSFEKDPYRIYVNASTKNVIVLGRILVKLACLDARAQYFKIADAAAAVDGRKDAIVIYTYGKEEALGIARELGRITGDTLTPTTPGLTQEVARGISVAADPASFKDMVSFGEHRARPFATALLCFRDIFDRPGAPKSLSMAVKIEVFRVLLAGAFRAHGIDPMDPSSLVSSASAEVSKRKDTKASAVTVPEDALIEVKLLLAKAQKELSLTS